MRNEYSCCHSSAFQKIKTSEETIPKKNNIKMYYDINANLSFDISIFILQNYTFMCIKYFPLTINHK